MSSKPFHLWMRTEKISSLTLKVGKKLKLNFSSYDRSTDKFNLPVFQISFNLCIAH